MELSDLGLPTHHTRVERWECDYNDHWNVRFYGRSFQMAAESVAAHSGSNPGAGVIRSRHMRFHREMRASTPVEVRSAVLRDAGELEGAVVHLMLGAGELAATALDLPGGTDHLPRVTPEAVSVALPRGIIDPAAHEAPAGADVTRTELGPIRGEDVDHTGGLRFDSVLRHSSTVQHAHLNKLGLTPGYTDRHRINRMGVEFRVTPGVTPAVGACLCGQTWISDIRGKALWATTSIATLLGETVAFIEACVVTVNLDTRKAVPVPDFLYRRSRGRTAEWDGWQESPRWSSAQVRSAAAGATAKPAPPSSPAKARASPASTSTLAWLRKRPQPCARKAARPSPWRETRQRRRT